MKLQDQRLLRESGYIDGSWVAADGGETLPVHNPATGAKLGVIPNMGTAETRRAIAAAAAAMPAWAARTAKDRAVILRRWFDLMMANQEDLAILMTAEQGKPLAESKGEIAYALPSSSGSPKKANVCTATSFPVIRPTSASWCCVSRWA
jgi:succinate-semialdehyde dehydrogenase/glutarate-semialdehyde dehydrogenase